MHPRPTLPLVILASALGWILLGVLLVGGAIGLRNDLRIDPNLGPRLPGDLLNGVEYGQSAQVDCTRSTWAGYLNPDLDHVPETQAQPLLVTVNLTAAPGLNWTFIQGHARTLFGVELREGHGLPVLRMRPPAGDEDLGGRLNHDQLYIQDGAGRLAYRQHSLYQIELYPSDDEEVFFLHELGHSLGLAHIDRDGQIMAHRSDRMALRIHECHADWLQHLAPTTWRHTWP